MHGGYRTNALKTIPIIRERGSLTDNLFLGFAGKVGRTIRTP
jgi:hypothetical protein